MVYETTPSCDNHFKERKCDYFVNHMQICSARYRSGLSGMALGGHLSFEPCAANCRKKCQVNKQKDKNQFAAILSITSSLPEAKETAT
jgi:hypothetical protein